MTTRPQKRALSLSRENSNAENKTSPVNKRSATTTAAAMSLFHAERFAALEKAVDTLKLQSQQQQQKIEDLKIINKQQQHTIND